VAAPDDRRRALDISDVPGAVEEAIRDIRRRQGRRARISARAVAVALGVDESTYRRWRRDLGLPHPGVIARLLRD
jgi:transcriptional regulator with XRE-family HTH domain